MKNIFHRLGAAALLSSAFMFAGCDPEFEDDIALSKGDLNLSKYVAVGNSLTAGYQDNGLYLEGQVYSYPNILANQFSLVGGGAFTQPYFQQGQENGSGYLRLTAFSPAGSPVLALVTNNLATVSVTNPAFKDKFTGPVQNLGIPDIKVADIEKNNFAQTNRYFGRITPETTPNQTYLDRVAASAPTFFTNWLGNNDVLSYATSGGFKGASELTDKIFFEQQYTKIVNALTAGGAKGVLINIPSVTSIPFFTTVGPSLKMVLTANNVPGLVTMSENSPARIQIATANIMDDSNPNPSTRGKLLIPLTASPYLSLIGRPSTGLYWRDLSKQTGIPIQNLLAAYSIDTLQAFGVSSGNPWPSSLLLDEAEQAKVVDYTNAFNASIAKIAASKDLALFDSNAYFNSILPNLVNGQKVPSLQINGVSYSPAFITGHLFSLDGVHPTPRGYAIVANELVRVINSYYKTTVPTIDVTQFRGVLIP